MVSTSCSTEGIVKMKRRTLDLAFSVGGLLFGGLILVLGLVLQNQSNFASTYVKEQFGQQKIEFTAVDYLHGEQDDAPCLVEFAGTLLDSGKKAECYANEYIAFHLASGATEAGYEGATYATIGAVQRGRGRTLHDFDPIDIVGVDVVERAGIRVGATLGGAGEDAVARIFVAAGTHAVDEDQRLIRERHAGRAAQPDGRAAAGIAESGTIVITDESTPDRLAALAPWYHIALLDRADIHRTIGDALAAMPKDPNIIWVTGPSKTADVEGILIQGVHGPGAQACLIV